MIESLTITNHLNDTLVIELRNPEASGFLIYDIDGLGPPSAEINKTELSSVDGSFIHSSRTTSREITLSLVFYGTPSIEDTRIKSYKFFPIKKTVKMEVKTANRTAYVYGRVQDNEPNIFSKQEGTKITIVCGSAYLHSAASGFVGFSSLDPKFEFPFMNDSLTEPLLIMGEIILETMKNVYYTGDAAVGVLIHFHATGAVSGIEISKLDTDQTIEIDSVLLAQIVGSDVIAGDDIYISTVVGDKYAILIRAGVEYNILNAIGKYPTWFQLEYGDNLFDYYASVGQQNLQVDISYTIEYEGV